MKTGCRRTAGRALRSTDGGGRGRILDTVRKVPIRAQRTSTLASICLCPGTQRQRRTRKFSFSFSLDSTAAIASH